VAEQAPRKPPVATRRPINDHLERRLRQNTKASPKARELDREFKRKAG
jgi:hypothetical protein